MSWDTDPSGVRDWYGLLGVTRTASDSEISTAIERVNQQAVSLFNYEPERSRNLQETVRLMKHDLLSGPGTRSLYHQLLDGGAPAAPMSLTDSLVPPLPPTGTAAPAVTPDFPPPTNGLASLVPPVLLPAAKRFKQFLESGWTCPLCAASSLPGEKFCAKCGGAMVAKVTSVEVVPGSAPFCEACGTKFKTSDRFCGSCGAPRV